MSTSSGYLSIRGLDIDVVYKDIKNLHIGVYPPLGRVRVAAPKRLDDDQVRLAVIRRLPWINRRREQLRAAERQSEREMITGETHYVWGRRYRLKVMERPGRTHFEVDGDRFLLYTPSETPSERRREYLDQWYRQQLREALPDLIAEWEERLELSVPKWSIRHMKTKWGSCNRESRHIWFNVQLAQKDPRNLEYILVHEMTHYAERQHGARFTELMDARLPDWRSRREDLNAAPLRTEKWDANDE